MTIGLAGRQQRSSAGDARHSRSGYAAQVWIGATASVTVSRFRLILGDLHARWPRWICVCRIPMPAAPAVVVRINSVTLPDGVETHR